MKTATVSLHYPPLEAEYDAILERNLDVCQQCRVYKGHLATCPTQLRTLAQRVALVARGYTPDGHERLQRRSEELGIPTHEFYLGVRLADEQAEIHRKFVGWHGHPEYGWTEETRAAEAEQMQAALARIVGEAEAE